MASSEYVRYASVTIDSVTRTPITVPRGCRRVFLTNADIENDATIYDADAAGSSLPLPAGSRIELPPVSVAGATVVWVQASAGTGPIRAEYHI